MLRTDRLQELSAYLRKLAKKHRRWRQNWFHLRSWAMPGWPDKECGTTACAGGWATQLFKEDGLYLAQRESDFCAGRIVMELAFENERNYEAMAKFMGITNAQAIRLFSPEEYSAYQQSGWRGAIAVANRIDAFLEWHNG